MRILIAEDNKKVARFIVKGLKEEAFAVDHARTGTEALDAAMSVPYDMIVLDIMLPEMDGLEVLKSLRDAGNTTPVLLLTARSRTDDKVKGLNLGADDYMTKPFAFDEFLARIRALTRRASTAVDASLSIDDLQVDCGSHTVTRGGNKIELTPKEYALLLYMLRNKNTVLTRSVIIDHVWDMQYDAGTNNVDVLIRYLRRKIDDNYQRKLIQTVRGMGYVLRSEDS